MSKYPFTQEELAFVKKTLKNVSNSHHRSETLETLKQFDRASVDFLLFQLGVVEQHKNAPEGVRYSAPYKNIGRKLWQNYKSQLRDAICGDSDTYKEERAKLHSQVESAIIILIPIVLNALRIPPESAGLAVVLSLLILKIGLKTFCATGGDLDKLRGKPGEICQISGQYINIMDGKTVSISKGHRFPSARAKSEWIYFETFAEDDK